MINLTKGLFALIGFSAECCNKVVTKVTFYDRDINAFIFYRAVYVNAYLYSQVQTIRNQATIRPNNRQSKAWFRVRSFGLGLPQARRYNGI